MADATESEEHDEAIEDSDLEPDVVLLDVEGDFDEDFPESFDEDGLDDELDDPMDEPLEDEGLTDDDLDDLDGSADAVGPHDEEGLALDPQTVDPDDDVEALRDGEFVCSSCHMAKRESALADADELLCRDCV